MRFTRHALAALLATCTAAASAQISEGSHNELAACRALAEVRGLGAPLIHGLLGDPAAFDQIERHVQGLNEAVSPGASPKGASLLDRFSRASADLSPLKPQVKRLTELSARLAEHREVVLKSREGLRALGRTTSDMAEAAENVLLVAVSQGATPAEFAAIAQVLMISQRLGRSGAEFITPDGLSPEAVFLLGKDLNSAREIVDGLIKGNRDLGLRPAKPALRAPLHEVGKHVEAARVQVDLTLRHISALVSFRDAQAAMQANLVPLDRELASVCTGR